MDQNQPNKQNSLMRRASHAPLDESDPEHIDLHISILPTHLWNDNINCAPYQSLSEAVTIGFIRCHIQSSIIALREEIEAQLADDEKMPSQYIFLKGVGRALVAIRPRQEQILTVENFKNIGSRLPPEICILEANSHRRNSIFNGKSYNNMNNSLDSNSSDNNNKNNTINSSKNKPRNQNRRQSSSLFDDSPEKSAQDLRNRASQKVQDRINNSKKVVNSNNNKPERRKSQTVRFPPVENGMVEYDSDMQAIPRHYPIEDRKLRESESSDLDMQMKHMRLSKGKRSSLKTSTPRSGSISQPNTSGRSSLYDDQISSVEQTPRNGKKLPNLSNNKNQRKLSLNNNNNPRDSQKIKIDSTQLASLKSLAKERKNSIGEIKLGGRRMSVIVNDSESSEFEERDHDTTISSIENYNPNSRRRSSGGIEKNSQNRNSKKDKGGMGAAGENQRKSKSLPPPMRSSNQENLNNTHNKYSEPEYYDDELYEQPKTRKSQKKSRNSEFDDPHKADSFEKFYRRQSEGNVGDICELNKCPDCGLTFKAEIDKKRHFNLIHKQSAAQIKARKRLLELKNKKKSGRFANRNIQIGLP
jgi:uncharacterized C2H2 Zn-finger protein